MTTKETRTIPLELLERAISAMNISHEHFLSRRHFSIANSYAQLIADLEAYLLDPEGAKIAMEEYERGEYEILNPEVNND